MAEPGPWGAGAGKSEHGGWEKHVSLLNFQAIRGQTQGRPALLPMFHAEGKTSEAPWSSPSRNLL